MEGKQVGELLFGSVEGGGYPKCLKNLIKKLSQCGLLLFVVVFFPSFFSSLNSFSPPPPCRTTAPPPRGRR